MRLCLVATVFIVGTAGLGGLVALGAAGCNAAPVRTEPPFGAPPLTTYDGPHGRPIAFGGGVCPIVTPHRHPFPAVPTTAFVWGPRGARDTRPRYAYVSPHPHHGRTCFREGWHLHLEPPLPTLVYDATLDAFTAAPPAEAPVQLTSRGVPKKRPLEIFEGPHAGCSFAHRHGHRPRDAAMPERVKVSPP